MGDWSRIFKGRRAPKRSRIQSRSFAHPYSVHFPVTSAKNQLLWGCGGKTRRRWPQLAPSCNIRVRNLGVSDHTRKSGMKMVQAPFETNDYVTPEVSLDTLLDFCLPKKFFFVDQKRSKIQKVLLTCFFAKNLHYFHTIVMYMQFFFTLNQMRTANLYSLNLLTSVWAKCACWKTHLRNLTFYEYQTLL